MKPIKTEMEPMLAASIDTKKGQHHSQLPYPGVLSAKLDGIRCMNKEGVPLSRKFKPIPNTYVREMLSHEELHGLDGELITFTNGFMDSFNTIQSKIMTDRGGKPDFKFFVFDKWDWPTLPYISRVAAYKEQCRRYMFKHRFLKAVPTHLVADAGEVDVLTQGFLDGGYEGSMFRTPDGPYKFGRSTFKEGYLVKIKPFERAEGTVIGFEEQMANNNEATEDAFGRTKRSSHKANKVGKGTLGNLILMTKEWGEVRVGAGTAAMRAEIWANQSKFKGKIVTFKYQAIGMKDSPRIPTFVGFRHKDDT